LHSPNRLIDPAPEDRPVRVHHTPGDRGRGAVDVDAASVTAWGSVHADDRVDEVQRGSVPVDSAAPLPAGHLVVSHEAPHEREAADAGNAAAVCQELPERGRSGRPSPLQPEIGESDHSTGPHRHYPVEMVRIDDREVGSHAYDPDLVRQIQVSVALVVGYAYASR